MIIKYSIGQITEVKDKESVEKREEKEMLMGDAMTYCKKCGLQHLIVKGEDRVCCGEKIIVSNN